MSLDRFVYFGEKRPTNAQIDIMLAGFFGVCGDVKRYSRTRVYVVLPGRTSSPIAELLGKTCPTAGEERVIEIFYTNGDGTLDVITRMQDAFTNCLAHGLAVCIANFWRGKYKEPT